MSYSVVIGLLLFFGLLLCWFAIVNIKRRRGFRAGSEALIGLSLLAIAGLGVAIVLNLHTYEKLTADEQVAVLQATQNGAQNFTVEIRYQRGGKAVVETYNILGDQWELDARVLKWNSKAAFFGLTSYYQLDRFEGRYRDTRQAINAERTIYDLAPAETLENGLSLRKLAREYGDLMPFYDTTFGNAVYMRLKDGARYEVRIGQTGLFARALNEAAKSANPPL